MKWPSGLSSLYLLFVGITQQCTILMSVLHPIQIYILSDNTQELIKLPCSLTTPNFPLKKHGYMKLGNSAIVKIMKQLSPFLCASCESLERLWSKAGNFDGFNLLCERGPTFKFLLSLVIILLKQRGWLKAKPTESYNNVASSHLFHSSISQHQTSNIARKSWDR